MNNLFYNSVMRKDEKIGMITFITIFIIFSAIRLGNRLADKAIAKRAAAPPPPIPTALPICKPPPPKKLPPPKKPVHIPDMDEIEYQRDRLRNLYTLCEAVENQLNTATKPERIEQLTRKQLTINAQIRKAQKIIQKELEK